MSYVLTKLLKEYENNNCQTWREIVKNTVIISVLLGC